jgi:outer membrane protein assembly factor BamB
MKSLTALSLTIALCLTASISRGDEQKGSPARWPQFRGPGSQGIGREGLRLPTKFGPNQHVIWKSALSSGHSSPCIWDDRIYITGFAPKAKKLETICLDRCSGKVLWRRAAPTQKIEHVHELNTPASSTPASDGEQVYVYFGSYGVLCYSKDGELKWNRPLDAIVTHFGSGTSPVVAGDLVLLNSGKGMFVFSLLALDRRTGKTVWQKDRSRGMATGLWSTPLLRHTGDGDEVIVAGGQEVAAYRLSDGAARWRLAGLPAISLSTPAIGENMLFLTLTNPVGDPDENVIKLPSFDELLQKYDKNKDGKLSAAELPDSLVMFTRGRADKIGDWAKVSEYMMQFDKDKDKAVSRSEWQEMLDSFAKFTPLMQIAVAAVRLDGKGDVSKTHVAWKVSKGVPEVPSPLYHEGRVYLVTDKGILSCRDAKSGKEIYRERLGGRGACYSSPIFGDGKIYISTEGGVVVVFKPGNRFEVLARNDLKERIVATPALVDNKIYLRTDRYLYAFGE